MKSEKPGEKEFIITVVCTVGGVLVCSVQVFFTVVVMEINFISAIGINVKASLLFFIINFMMVLIVEAIFMIIIVFVAVIIMIPLVFFKPAATHA